MCCIFAFQLSTLSNEKLPNFVIIFLDDAGWGDFNTFQSTKYPTPNVDKLAEEGTKFTQFYVPQAVCSASRAALLVVVIQAEQVSLVHMAHLVVAWSQSLQLLQKFSKRKITLQLTTGNGIVAINRKRDL